MQLRDNGRNGQNGRQKTMPNKRKKCGAGKRNPKPNPKPKPNPTQLAGTATGSWCNLKLYLNLMQRLLDIYMANGICNWQYLLCEMGCLGGLVSGWGKLLARTNVIVKNCCCSLACQAKIILLVQ